jgi:diacylglycerol O-acyltransferase / wax synthase
MSGMTHLSVVDGAFLHLESPEMPMHVGSLALFDPAPEDGTPWIDRLKAHVVSRMHLAPVFTRKLALMPFDLANPVWIQDDDIDLDYHVRYLVLNKPGTLAQLEALAARLHSSLLDRSRPLWEFYVIDGLASGQTGFYSKVHHAAVDGQAAVAMGNSVFDMTVEPRRVKPPLVSKSNQYQLGVAELLSAALSNQVRQLVQFAKLLPPLAGTAYSAARTALAARRSGTSNASSKPDSSKLTSRFKLAPATPFNAPITNQRAFVSVTLPLNEIKQFGKLYGASINDMVLWLCSTAMRDYLAESRELPDKSLVAGVPISLRSEGDASSNNQVSGTVIDLATHIGDPLARLKAIMDGTRSMKQQMWTFGDLIPKDFPSLGSPWLLSGLASLYGRSRIADKLRIANVIISNVPGPQVPLYLAGAKMSGIYPVSIVAHGIALNITVQSYMGQLCFGLLSCRRAVPDVHELGLQLGRALEKLRRIPLPEAENVVPDISAKARRAKAAEARNVEPKTSQKPGAKIRLMKSEAVTTPHASSGPNRIVARKADANKALSKVSVIKAGESTAGVRKVDLNKVDLNKVDVTAKAIPTKVLASKAKPSVSAIAR